MLSNTPETPAAAPLRPNEATRTEPPAADPHVIIEVLSAGGGGTNDPGPTNTPPPGAGDPGDPTAAL